MWGAGGGGSEISAALGFGKARYSGYLVTRGRSSHAALSVVLEAGYHGTLETRNAGETLNWSVKH